MVDIFLHPGDLHFGEAGTCVRTVLGSCLAIVMWHPLRLIGGMSHCLLPSRPNRSQGLKLDGRYVDEALPLMLLEAVRHDSDPNEYRIKLFGGGRTIEALQGGRGVPVGDQNIHKAVSNLSLLGLRIAAYDLGGSCHRWLVFDIGTGTVWVRTVSGQREVLTVEAGTA